MRSSQIHLKKMCMLMSFGLLLSHNAVFAFQSENSTSNSISCLDHIPASVKKAERENSVVYSFNPISFPEQNLLDGSLERFRQVKGFVSLSVNAQNEVELVIAKDITEKEKSHLLMISARLYGYIGYQIIG